MSAQRARDIWVFGTGDALVSTFEAGRGELPHQHKETWQWQTSTKQC